MTTTTLVYTVFSDKLHVGYLPANTKEDYTKTCVELGDKAGWDSLHTMFFHPDGTLYAVWNDKLYMAKPPKPIVSDNEQRSLVANTEHWFATAQFIGKRGWFEFPSLFFDPDGTLFGVRKDGAFYKGKPPIYPNESWYTGAIQIGGKEWHKFSHLFFGQDGTTLYGILGDKLFKKAVPNRENGDEWAKSATQIGGEGWNSVLHCGILPDGEMYAVNYRNHFVKGPIPDEESKNNWLRWNQYVGENTWGHKRFLLVYGDKSNKKEEKEIVVVAP